MKRLIICFIALLICSGCAWFETREDKPVNELVSDGMEEYRRGNYKKSIEAFEKLKDWYPFSKYAMLAQLKIADAYFNLEEYEDAVFAYEEFENLHPRNEAVPYVVYQIGLSYFNQIDTPDRDQSTAKKALDTFGRLLAQHPNNEYTNKARENIKKCLKSLSGHELYVGKYYYKNKYYKAALSRFMTVLTKYPDVGVHYDALQYIAVCEATIKKLEEMPALNPDGPSEK
ncbi:outer membrane protein assembly factor BamD [Thermodesulfobacteriota bacterium]